MAKESYIKLYRKVFNNELFIEIPYDRWHAFEFLLLRARYCPTDVLIKGQTIHLNAGQLICSLGNLADKWGWSRGKVIRFFETLNELGMITYHGTTCGTVVTIENYSKYQTVQTSDGTSDSTTDGTTDGTSDGTTDGTHKKKVYKKDNKKVYKKDKRSIYAAVPPELSDAFNEWAHMRREIKKPITTERTVTMALNKLDKLAATIEEKIAIINQSTDRCWTSFYELKDESGRSAAAKSQQDYYDMVDDWTIKSIEREKMKKGGGKNESD